MFPDGSGRERIVITGEHVRRHAEAHAGIDNALDVGPIDGIIFKNVSRDEDCVDTMRSRDVGERGGRGDALAADVARTRTRLSYAHADLPVGGVKDLHE